MSEVLILAILLLFIVGTLCILVDLIQHLIAAWRRGRTM
jgi:hypothetical protein